MDASYKIQRGIHVHLIQFFMCPEFWVHITLEAGLLRFSLRNLSKLLVIYGIYNDFIEIKRSKVTFLNVFYRWKCGK